MQEGSQGESGICAYLFQFGKLEKFKFSQDFFFNRVI